MSGRKPTGSAADWDGFDPGPEQWEQRKNRDKKKQLVCIRNQTGPQRSVGGGGGAQPWERGDKSDRRGAALGTGGTGRTPCCSVVSQLLKLGNGL